DALDLLGKVSPRQSKIVEFRFFGGLNTDEIGKILQISPRTVLGEWSVARAWLANEMKRNV
ncbi:MAG: RNA polymerase subunit sigma-70, partial [Blastocatellia bacterium]|nr:RNA polymerase subunit sigma-70 [Blastocatellia bacterium]